MDLFTVRGDFAKREFRANSELAEPIVKMPGFKAIQLIAKYLVVLVTYVNFNIRSLVLIEYFKLIAYPYWQKNLVGFVNARGIITWKLHGVPVDAGYLTVNYTQPCAHV